MFLLTFVDIPNSFLERYQHQMIPQPCHKFITSSYNLNPDPNTGGLRLKLRIILVHSLLYSMGQGLSVKPEFAGLASVASQLALGIPSLPFVNGTIGRPSCPPGILHGFPSSNFFDKDLATKPSPQSL